MPRLTKQDQIDSLTEQLAEANQDIIHKQYELNRLQEVINGYMEHISDLDNEIARLVHTPEFAADTESAFNRGRHDGIRSLTYKAQKDMLSLSNEIIDNMNELVNKYTRALTLDIFLGKVEPAQNAKKLPDTDFAKNLITDRYKIPGLTSSLDKLIEAGV